MVPRNTLLTTLLLVAAVILAACGSPAGDAVEQPGTDSETAPVESAPESETEPDAPPIITRTDGLGREVMMPAQVSRIVTIAPSVTESLYAIGAGDLVVGRTSFDNYPEEVLALPEVGGFSADSVSVEVVVSLEPDVVLGGSDLQAPLAEALEAAGVPFYIFNAQKVGEVYDTLAIMGEMTGHEVDAQAVIDDMQARIAAVQDATSDVPDEERPTVFYEVWDEPLLTAGPETYIGEMIVLAGGVDIFSDVTEPYAQVSAETIIERQPQVIMGPNTHSEALTVDILSARPGWETIPAVQDGAIVILDGDMLSRSGPRMADAIELMAASLYPDRFGG